MKINSMTVFAGIVLLIGSAFVWRLFTNEKISAPVHTILYDPSDSKIDGCSCLKEHASSLLNNATTKGQTIVFSTLGTPETGYQPKVKGKYEIPINDSAFSDVKKFEDQKIALLNDLEYKCNAIPRTKTTPLFQGVQTTVEDMNQSCGPDSACTLFVQTDLEEIIDQKLIQAFKDEKSNKPASVEPSTIDNSKLSIIFSGTAEVILGSDDKGNASQKNKTDIAKKAKQRLGDRAVWEKVWKRLFLNPDRLRFEPLCDGSGE